MSANAQYRETVEDLVSSLPRGPAVPPVPPAKAALPRLPSLPAPEDARALREEGLGYLRKLAGEVWTDHNLHDPGITILETLCFALTDLAYRANHPIEDLLAGPLEHGEPPESAFFTARQILPCNPVTAKDFRKAAIDCKGVRNAWVTPASSPEIGGEPPLYVDESRRTLTLNPAEGEAVDLRGLYVVQLELELDPAFGDLNDARIRSEIEFPLVVDGVDSVLRVEVQFLRWGEGASPVLQDIDPADWSPQSREWRLPALLDPDAVIGVDPVPNSRKDSIWRATIRAGGALGLAGGTLEFRLEPREPVQDFDALQARVGDALRADELKLVRSWVRTYGDKAVRRQEIVRALLDRLQGHRNLCEDFLAVRGIDVEEIGVCADVQVRPGADIDQIMANMEFEIEGHLAPPISFYSLEERLAEGAATDALFNGPRLQHGFQDEHVLEAPWQRGTLYGSDIMRILMGIDGIVAVRELSLTSFGFPEPQTERWELTLASGAPGSTLVSRFSRAKSRFRFFAGFVPHAPNLARVDALLDERRSREGRPRLAEQDRDLKISFGEDRQLARYTSVRNHFPAAYALAPEELGKDASAARKARVKQLQGYLMFYDQILADYLAQLNHAKTLLSVRRPFSSGLRTRFAQSLKEHAETESLLTDPGSYEKRIGELAEDESTRLRREDAILDHLLARHQEDFSDYVAMMWALRGSAAQNEIIQDKLDFLANYPAIGHDRGKSFNYLHAATSGRRDATGLEQRIAWLLNQQIIRHVPLQVYFDSACQWRFRVEYGDGNIVLKSARAYSNEAQARTALEQLALAGIDPSRYETRISDRADGAVFLAIRQSDAASAPLLAVGTDFFLPGAGAFEAARDPLVNLFRDFAAEQPRRPPAILYPGHFRIHVFKASRSRWQYRVVRHNPAQPENLTDVVLHSRDTFPDDDTAHKAVEALITSGANAANYKKSKRLESYTLRIVDADGINVARGTDRYKDADLENMDRRIAELCGYFDPDSLHIVEHILLRPRHPGAPLLSIGLDENCTPAAAEDPYSFRVSAILPYWPNRFRAMEYRHFVERMLHQEIPAHVSLKICWVDELQMLAFKQAHAKWLGLMANVPSTGDGVTSYNLALQELLKVLQSLTSIYPVAMLHDCRVPGGANPVVLGQTRLGKFKEADSIE